MTDRPVTVLIADDHRLMREGTAALLQADERIRVVGLARHGREAVELVRRRSPDVVLLDLNMPVMGGLDACAAIREAAPATAVLILTVSEEEPDLYASLKLGAGGYLLKDMPPAELLDAVLEAGSGHPRIAPRLAGRLLAEFGAAGGSRRSADPLGPLSQREREVLGLLAEGLRNREIAQRLFVSEATVKTHVRHVLEKLRFRNRAEAAAFAARHIG
jgi:DNA-binding NarL/FixJ family response regulator